MRKHIILASNSPRRRELLAGLDLDFTVDTANGFHESPLPDVPARELPVRMSVGKSHGFHRPLEDGEILITADTVVVLDGLALGKPRDRQDAVRMLKLLAGREHEVITAVTIRSPHREESFADSTTVWFNDLSDSEIEYYIDKYEPYDKAGAYGVQEWIGLSAIGRVDGSFYNVMGLPVHRIYEVLKGFLED